MGGIASETWTNDSDSYSNFALGLLGGVVGAGAGPGLSRRHGLPA